MRRPALSLVPVLCIVHLSLCIAVLAADLPSAQELLDKMTASLTRMQSFQADVHKAWNGPNSNGTGTGRLAMLKAQRDGKTIEMSFMEMKQTAIYPDGRERTEAGKEVNDGLFFWAETGPTRVEKTNAPGPERLSWSELKIRTTKDLFNAFRFKVVGEDVIEGQKMYVLSGTQAPVRQNDSTPPAVLKLWVGQDDLFIHRTTSGSMTEENLNVKIDQKIDPALFTYTPPPGATIIDQTKH